MAKKEGTSEEDLINAENFKYIARYNKSFLNLSKLPQNDLQLIDIIAGLFLIQENYNSKSRNIRNMFFFNSLIKANLVEEDSGLPENIKIWEYHVVFDALSEEDVKKLNIFTDYTQWKIFHATTCNRMFKAGIDENITFYDKVILNTLIKAKILIRCDSSSESVESLLDGLKKKIISK